MKTHYVGDDCPDKHIAMRIAIVGSRDWTNPDIVREYISRLPIDWVVISGHARGVDRYAESFARERGLLVESYPAEWERYGKKAGYIRNELLVQRCDCLLAFWDLKSRGTKHTIDLIQNTTKDYLVVGPDGPVMGRQRLDGPVASVLGSGAMYTSALVGPFGSSL